MKQNTHFLTYEFAHNAVQKRKEERSLKVGGVFILWNWYLSIIKGFVNLTDRII